VVTGRNTSKIMAALQFKVPELFNFKKPEKWPHRINGNDWHIVIKRTMHVYNYKDKIITCYKSVSIKSYNIISTMECSTFSLSWQKNVKFLIYVNDLPAAAVLHTHICLLTIQNYQYLYCPTIRYFTSTKGSWLFYFWSSVNELYFKFPNWYHIKLTPIY